MLTFDVDGVKARLAQFGYTASGVTDELLLLYCVEKVRSTIKNEINWQDVPEGLYYVATDMAVGEFLQAKLTFDPDSINLDLDAAVSEIREGDTDVKFGIGDGSLTPEQRLTNFINYLLTHGRDEFGSFRRIRW